MRDDLLDEMALYPYADPPAQEKSDPAVESFVAPPVTYTYDQVMHSRDYFPFSSWQRNIWGYRLLLTHVFNTGRSWMRG